MKRDEVLARMMRVIRQDSISIDEDKSITCFIQFQDDYYATMLQLRNDSIVVSCEPLMVKIAYNQIKSIEFVVEDLLTRTYILYGKNSFIHISHSTESLEDDE